MAPDDAESTLVLLDRYRGGDSSALDRLLRRHVPALTRWASGRLPVGARDLSDTEDLVQDTIVAAVRNLDRFEIRGEGAFSAYLRQAVVNRIRSEFRRLKRRPLPQELDDDLPVEEDSPLDLAIGREAVERYEAALARLSQADREAVIARVELAMSYADVATALGKPTAEAARMAVKRALGKLAHLMCP
jgi:RNA polymerase sigma-70 factor (ECF subfamily)